MNNEELEILKTLAEGSDFYAEYEINEEKKQIYPSPLDELQQTGTTGFLKLGHRIVITAGDNEGTKVIAGKLNTRDEIESGVFSNPILGAKKITDMQFYKLCIASRNKQQMLARLGAKPRQEQQQGTKGKRL